MYWNSAYSLTIENTAHPTPIFWALGHSLPGHTRPTFGYDLLHDDQCQWELGRSTGVDRRLGLRKMHCACDEPVCKP